MMKKIKTEKGYNLDWRSEITERTIAELWYIDIFEHREGYKVPQYIKTIHKYEEYI